MRWTQVHKSDRGTLAVVESKTMPFVPKRMFYVKDVPKGSRRGNHAHYTTRQLLVCVKGKILVELDYGNETQQVLLNEDDSVLVNSLVWDSQVYQTGDDILMSICSTEHDPEDYITDHDIFLKVLTERGVL